MKLIIGNGLIKCIVFLFLQATVLGSCTKISKGNKRDARTYFTIDSLDRKIVLPVLFNDSIVSNLAFDSGAALGAFIVDSTFCSAHPSIYRICLLTLLLHMGVHGLYYVCPHLCIQLFRL